MNTDFKLNREERSQNLALAKVVVHFSRTHFGKTKFVSLYQHAG
jgi:hypothetical protein